MVSRAAVDHYLNDFITIGPAGSDECHENLDHILAVQSELGVPLASYVSQNRDPHQVGSTAPPTWQTWMAEGAPGIMVSLLVVLPQRA